MTSHVTLTAHNPAVGTLSGNTLTGATSTSTKIDFTRVLATYTTAPIGDSLV